MPYKRLPAINSLLSNYSKGYFDMELEVSKDFDEIDAIISGINTLGKELKETTISKEFFSSIYNTVTDMLFVVNNTGEILDINKTTENRLGHEITGKNLFCLCQQNDTNFETLKQKLNAQTNVYKFETIFTSTKSEQIFVSCSASQIIKNHYSEGYLIIAEDITLKKQAENKIIQAVLETQENERQRVANDLHDSTGQELSSLKMMLGVLKKKIDNPENQQIVNNTIEILEDSIQNLRGICFNLMPSVLENGGLTYAVRQLIEKTPFKIYFYSNVSEVNLGKTAEISVYRVIQEFINNTIKHSEAESIHIDIIQEKKKLAISIMDDGKGFDMKKKSNLNGRGLNTMRSRVETFGGNFVLLSKVGIGTKLKIIFT